MAKLSKQGIYTIGTGVASMPLFMEVMHMGTFGLVFSGIAALAAYRHGLEISEGIDEVASKIGTSRHNIVNAEVRRDRSNVVPTEVSRNRSNPVSSDISILLGFDRKNKEIRKRMEELKSILVLGAAGLGKSSTVAFIVSQFIEQGATISIVDKHARSDESLSSMLSSFEKVFRQSPAFRPANAEEMAESAMLELEGRIEGSLSIEHPYLLIVDEFSDIMRQATQSGPWQKAALALVSIIEEIITGGRKYNVFVICIGQIVNASRTGGTEIRDMFNTRVIHGMKESQAHMVLPKQYKRDVANLEKGQVILDIEGKEDPFFVQVPLLTKADIKRVVASIGTVETQVLPETSLPGEMYHPAAKGLETQMLDKEEEMVVIGRDNKTKDEVCIPKSTIDFLARLRSLDKLGGFREVQTILECSETHARAVSKIVDETIEGGRLGSQPVAD